MGRHKKIQTPEGLKKEKTDKVDYVVLSLYEKLQEYAHLVDNYSEALLAHLKIRHSVIADGDLIIEHTMKGTTPEEFESLARERG